MKFPQFCHKIYAKLNGYFWLPCPICNEFFGGHENMAFLATDWYHGVQVCSNCEGVAKRFNRDLKPPARKVPYSVKRTSDTEIKIRFNDGFELAPGEVAVCSFGVGFFKDQPEEENRHEHEEET